MQLFSLHSAWLHRQAHKYQVIKFRSAHTTHSCISKVESWICYEDERMFSYLPFSSLGIQGKAQDKFHIYSEVLDSLLCLHQSHAHTHILWHIQNHVTNWRITRINSNISNRNKTNYEMSETNFMPFPLQNEWLHVAWVTGISSKVLVNAWTQTSGMWQCHVFSNMLSSANLIFLLLFFLRNPVHPYV